MFKKILKKIIPNKIFLFYHRVLAYLAVFLYRYPSRKMIVIGITGTSGKSTTINLIANILEQAGFKVGFTTTFNFKIAAKEMVNKMRMTMPGRFTLQRLLRNMLKNGCNYAIIETTSQGIAQFRHISIDYDVVVFTNLSPEHIESHGSFEKYRQAKEKLFEHLINTRSKIINGRKINKVSIINIDDKSSDYFLKYSADEKYGYKISSKQETLNNKQIKIIKAEDIELTSFGSRFTVNGRKFTLNLLGNFNVSNALSAITVAISQGIGIDVCQKALSRIKTMPGRMEIVSDKPLIIIDQAHTPESLEQVYKTIKSLKFGDSKLICVFGATGGGRDKWKRPILGKIAQKYGDYLIVTNEDPYDENPEVIIKEVISGINNNQKLVNNGQLFKILDRKKAIKKAIDMAQEKDIIIITGKGCEQCIVSKGKKIPWDDRKVVRELLIK